VILCVYHSVTKTQNGLEKGPERELNMALSQCSTITYVLCNCNLILDACSYSHVPHVNQQSNHNVELSPLSFSNAGLHVLEAHFPATIIVYHNIETLILRMIALQLFEMFQHGY